MVGTILGIAGLVCWLIILIDAFKKSILKGLIALLCWFYLVYYALVEFKHDNKLLIVIFAVAFTLGFVTFR